MFIYSKTYLVKVYLNKKGAFIMILINLLISIIHNIEISNIILIADFL